MSATNFIKMHGLGNDYIFFDLFTEKFPEENVQKLAIKLSDRHFGIGGDGIVLIKKPQKSENDARMQIYNTDGSEAEMCGNAMRCVGKYLFETHFQTKQILNIETLAGLIKPQKEGDLIRVDMGEPEIDLINYSLEVAGQDFQITTVSMGNPHAVIFVEQVDKFPVQKIGSIIENRKDLFPQRTNVEFIEILNQNELKMRVWERGSGETLACGTGACAALVAAKVNGFTESKANIHLLGGDLEIEWDQISNHVFKTGVAEISFTGKVELTKYLC